MADGELRALERRGRATGAPEDEVAYLRALVRAGRERQVALAAYCGWPAARVALGGAVEAGPERLSVSLRAVEHPWSCTPYLPEPLRTWLSAPRVLAAGWERLELGAGSVQYWAFGLQAWGAVACVRAALALCPPVDPPGWAQALATVRRWVHEPTGARADEVYAVLRSPTTPEDRLERVLWAAAACSPYLQSMRGGAGEDTSDEAATQLVLMLMPATPPLPPPRPRALVPRDPMAEADRAMIVAALIPWALGRGDPIPRP